ARARKLKTAARLLGLRRRAAWDLTWALVRLRLTEGGFLARRTRSWRLSRSRLAGRDLDWGGRGRAAKRLGRDGPGGRPGAWPEAWLADWLGSWQRASRMAAAVGWLAACLAIHFCRTSTG